MLNEFIKNLSILKKFLFINFIVFLIIGILTIFYLNSIKPSIIKDKTPLKPNHRSTIFGLSPLDASIFSSLCLAVLFTCYSLIAPESAPNSNFEYSLAPNDKLKKSVQSQILKNNANITANDELDSLDLNSKEYKSNKKNKIKFVNY